MTYEQAFMFFLPRICEHCLNPSCVASCPSGAMYKREEDGIVLVDQDKCRGWRYCVSGCPYKKVYFNHRTGKAEKCTLCYPRIEIGQPTICSETCVGRIRYLGLVLYDADRVQAAASVPGRARPARRAARRVPRPGGPGGPRGRARATGSPTTGSRPRGARRSTTWRSAGAWRCRCTPSSGRCRWSGTCRRSRPVVSTLEIDGYEADPDDVFGAIDNLRIPLEYLANLLTAGDVEQIRFVLHRLAAMRAYMRKREVLGETDESVPERVGLTGRRARAHVPAAGDRRLRRPLRDPAGARRARRAADAGAGQLRAGLRGRSGQLRRGRPAARTRPRRTSPTTASSFHLIDILTARGAAGAMRRAADRRPPPWALLSYLLRYPTAEVARRRAPELRGRDRRAARRARCATRSSASWRRGPATRRRSPPRYVETFDLRRRATLELTYYAHGDTRERGMALLRLKKLYRAAGLPLDTRRAARPPHGDARLRRARAARPRRGGAGPAPAGDRAAAAVAARPRQPVRARARRRRGAACRRSASPSARRSRGWRAKGRPRRPSGWSRTGRRRPCRPERARERRRDPAVGHPARTPRSRRSSSGLWWRYRADQFGWTSGSTQIFEHKILGWAGPAFHYGALAAIGGHVIGLMIPKSFTEAIGMSEQHLPLVLGGRGRGRRRGVRRRFRRARVPARHQRARAPHHVAHRPARLLPAGRADRAWAAG